MCIVMIYNPSLFMFLRYQIELLSHLLTTIKLEKRAMPQRVYYTYTVARGIFEANASNVP